MAENLKDKNVHSISEFKEIKKSKVFIVHLKAILRAIDLSIKALDHFKIYIPVMEIILTMKDQKRVLEIHLKNHENFIKEGKQ